MQLHLPLSAVDRVLQPPRSYLVVQDGLALFCMFGWTISYVLYVWQAFHDKSYGMPIVTIWANISWEFLFGVVYPNSVAQVVVFVPWLLIDVGIVYATCKFGPDQLKNSPLVAKNLSWIMAIGIPFTMIMFWTLIKTVGTDEASFYIAFSDQLLVSSLSVAHLLKRGNTSGHSLAIWFWRSTGTLASVVEFVWRYWYYPQTYSKVAQPFTIFLFTTATIVDLIYPFVYVSVSRKEKKKSK